LRRFQLPRRPRPQTIDPLTGSDRLASLRVGAEGRPIAFLLVVLVRNRTLDDQNKRTPFAFGGRTERSEKIVPILIGEKGIVKMYLWNPGQASEHNVFDARLGGSGHGNRIAVAPQSGGNPEDVNF
jgi:hypothetical protein